MEPCLGYLEVVAKRSFRTGGGRGALPQLLGYRWRWAGQLWKVDVYGSKVGHYREGGCQLPFRRLLEGLRKAN